MSALVVKKRSRKAYTTAAVMFEPCENGCRAKNGRGINHLGRLEATHVATCLDNDIYLCKGCAALWERTWASALAEPEPLAA